MYFDKIHNLRDAILDECGLPVIESFEAIISQPKFNVTWSKFNDKLFTFCFSNDVKQCSQFDYKVENSKESDDCSSNNDNQILL